MSYTNYDEEVTPLDNGDLDFSTVIIKKKEDKIIEKEITEEDKKDFNNDEVDKSKLDSGQLDLKTKEQSEDKTKSDSDEGKSVQLSYETAEKKDHPDAAQDLKDKDDLSDMKDRKGFSDLKSNKDAKDRNDFSDMKDSKDEKIRRDFSALKTGKDDIVLKEQNDGINTKDRKDFKVEHPIKESYKEDVKVQSISQVETNKQVHDKSDNYQDSVIKEVIHSDKIKEKEEIIPVENDLKLLQDATKNIKDLKVKSIVKGKVVDKNEEELFIDVGFKSDGIIQIENEADRKLQKGDVIEVYILKIEDDSGIIQLSKNKVDTIRAWDKIHDAYQNNKPIVGKILSKQKGGFLVDIGINAFLPKSQLSTKRQTNFDKYIDKQYEFKIIRIEESKNNIVISRRALLEEKTKLERDKFFESLKVGDIVEGKVKTIVPYGAFVELVINTDALLHINDISWGKVNEIEDFIKVNDTIKCMILNVDKLEGKIKVGLKQLKKDPWSVIEDNYRIRDIVSGKIVSITKFGLFVEIEPGLEGLVPFSEVSWSSVNQSDITKRFNVNDAIKCRVLNIDVENKKILLSIKQVSANPWELFKNRNANSETVSGTVVKILQNGVIIRVNDNIEGFVRKEDITWDKHIKSIDDYLAVGENLTFKILDIQPDKKNLLLGLKQMTPDPWEDKLKNLKQGSLTKGVITSITKYGLFAKLPNGLEGLIHFSQIPENKSSDLSKHYKVGDSVDIEILKIDVNSHKIALSITKHIESVEKKEMKEYLKNQEKNEVTLGNLINLEGLLDNSKLN